MPAPDLHQHDLTTDAARLVVAESHVRAGQRVCKFGAGTGGLTRALLDVGCHVLAVEIDCVAWWHHWRIRSKRSMASFLPINSTWSGPSRSFRWFAGD